MFVLNVSCRHNTFVLQQTWDSYLFSSCLFQPSFYAFMWTWVPKKTQFFIVCLHSLHVLEGFSWRSLLQPKHAVRINYNTFFICTDEKDVALRIILIKHYGTPRLNIILMIRKNRQIVLYFKTQKQQMGFHGVEEQMCHSVKSDMSQDRIRHFAYSDNTI